MSLSHLSVNQPRAVLSPEEICAFLRQMIPSMVDFGRSEETQFVQIGNDLVGFLHRSRMISRGSAEVVDSLLQKEGDDILASLSTLMDGLDQHIVQLLAAARTHEDSLYQLTVHIERIDAPLQYLAKVVKILYSLSFATKVESTQGSSVVVLQSLADDLKGLAIKINTKAEAVRDRLKTMLLLARSARENTQTMAEVSLRHAGSNLQQCRRLMDDVASRRVVALAAARHLQDDSATIAAALSEIVTSVQFHDITRQQVDHVQMALREFCDRLAAGEAGEQLAVEVADLCRVQSAQLRHTRQELVSAVLRMISNLRSIAPAVNHLAQKTRTLSTSTEEAGASFFRDIEPILTAVTKIVAGADHDDQQASAAVAAVLGVLNELSLLLHDIESIGIEMKMIAFNAGITAAHNLERGAGLGVIARSIQDLSGEVLSRTNEFAGVYREMERLAREMNLDTTSTLLPSDPRSTRLHTETAIFMARLQSMDQGVIQLMTDLDQEAMSLATDVVVTASKITIHVEAGKIIDQLLAELDALAGSFQAASPYAGAPKILDLLSRNYTMQSERRIHAEVHKTGGGTDSPAAGQRHELQDLTGLGENVELF